MNSNNSNPNTVNGQRIYPNIKDFYQTGHNQKRKDAPEGRFAIVPRTFQKYGKHLSPPAKWVYVTLRSYYNYKIGRCDPSIKTISFMSGIGETTVKKAIKELETFGWLKRRNKPRSKNARGNQPKTYVQFDLKQPLRRAANGRLHYYHSPTKEQADEYAKIKKSKKPETQFIREKRRQPNIKQQVEVAALSLHS